MGLFKKKEKPLKERDIKAINLFNDIILDKTYKTLSIKDEGYGTMVMEFEKEGKRFYISTFFYPMLYLNVTETRIKINDKLEAVCGDWRVMRKARDVYESRLSF